MSAFALHTENLAIGYKSGKSSRIVASSINIRLEPGQLTALVGMNGAGKSTLLRTLSGLQQPISGDIFIGDTNLSGISQQGLAQRLSLVLTENLPPGGLSIREIIALGRHPYTNWIGKLSPEDVAVVEEAIALAEVDGLQHYRQHELSDGQLQKVLIARALSQDTPLILLDEPSTHLDLQHKASLFRLLRKLCSRGKCVLFSTHDISEALQFCDHIILMLPGKTVQGTPENLIDSGVFDALFDDPDLSFDREKRQFIFKKH